MATGADVSAPLAVGDRVIVRTPFSRTDRLCTIRRVNPDGTYAVDDGHPTDLDGWLGVGWRYAEADVRARCIRVVGS